MRDCAPRHGWGIARGSRACAVDERLRRENRILKEESDVFKKPPSSSRAKSREISVRQRTARGLRKYSDHRQLRDAVFGACVTVSWRAAFPCKLRFAINFRRGMGAALWSGGLCCSVNGECGDVCSVRLNPQLPRNCKWRAKPDLCQWRAIAAGRPGQALTCTGHRSCYSKFNLTVCKLNRRLIALCFSTFVTDSIRETLD